LTKGNRKIETSPVRKQRSRSCQKQIFDVNIVDQEKKEEVRRGKSKKACCQGRGRLLNEKLRENRYRQ